MTYADALMEAQRRAMGDGERRYVNMKTTEGDIWEGSYYVSQLRRVNTVAGFDENGEMIDLPIH